MNDDVFTRDLYNSIIRMKMLDTLVKHAQKHALKTLTPEKEPVSTDNHFNGCCPTCGNHCHCEMCEVR